MCMPQSYQSNGSINPLVIFSREEYQDKGSKYMADKSKPRFRIVFFHEFKWGVESGRETGDLAYDYRLFSCITDPSLNKNYSLWLVNNQYRNFSLPVFEITYQSGIIFFRDNKIVEILNGCDVNQFKTTLNQINNLPVKHSPKKNRLLAELAAKNKEQPNKNNTKSSNGCIVM